MIATCNEHMTTRKRLSASCRQCTNPRQMLQDRLRNEIQLFSQVAVDEEASTQRIFSAFDITLDQQAGAIFKNQTLKNRASEEHLFHRLVMRFE